MRIRKLVALLISGVLVGVLGCAQRAQSQTPGAEPSPAVVAEPAASSATTPGFTLCGVTLLDGGKTNVQVQGQKIARIGAEKSGEEIDASGLTLLPGLIDAHVHLGFYQPSEVLAAGLTSVRDLGWDPDLAFGWKQASAEDPAWGPHTLVVGNMLTARDGYPFGAGWAPRTTAAVGTPEKVEELAARGADFIKVTLQPGGPVLEAAALKALVLKAHEKGLKVTAHVSSLPELEKALDCEVDELAHMVFDSSSIPDVTIGRMVKANVVVVPTLRINPSPVRVDNLRRFFKAGGKVVFGTDKGNGGGPGIDIEELQLMSQAMPAADVLRSATDGAADWLGMPERGRVAREAVADLLLVRGNPLQDWTVLAQPAMVIHEGRVVRREGGP